VDIKEAAHTDAAAPTDADTTTIGGSVARRRVLVAGISGTALSLLPFLGGRASASGRNNSSAATTDPTSGSTGDTTGDTTAATEAATTTTTAPPRRPTEDDIALLSFAQSVELTIRDLYDVAITAGTFEGTTLSDVKAIREAHEAYAQSLSGLLGRVAPNTPLDALFTSLEGDFSGDLADVATAAQALENTAVATHTDIVGQLLGIDGSSLVASMLIVEARHATVLATIAGVSDLDQQLASDGEALSPTDYAK
jgi:hypothetical protein